MVGEERGGELELESEKSEVAAPRGIERSENETLSRNRKGEAFGLRESRFGERNKKTRTNKWSSEERD